MNRKKSKVPSFSNLAPGYCENFGILHSGFCRRQHHHIPGKHKQLLNKLDESVEIIHEFTTGTVRLVRFIIIKIQV